MKMQTKVNNVFKHKKLNEKIKKRIYVKQTYIYIFLIICLCTDYATAWMLLHNKYKIKKLNGYHLILINRDITIFISLFFPIILYEKFSWIIKNSIKQDTD